MRQELDAVKNLTLLEGTVADLLITSPNPKLGETKSYGRVQGIALGIDFSNGYELTYLADNGEIIHASQVIITTGTFLGGEIHIGMSSLKGD